MPQPRKEQVKNLKTKYTRFTGAGNLAIGGGPVQTVSNTGLEAFYDNLLAATKTGAVGGAETSSPAVLYGGSGPFSVAAGNSFTLTIAGVNSGNPVSIVIQSGDVVTLGGSPVVTTARLTDRINQVMFGAGVASAVADNVNGQIVLKSAGGTGVIVGDSSVMTLSEVTPGILNVLGFTALATVTASGTTAPRRGLVTVSADGLGGVVQLRKIDAVVPDASGAVLRHALAGNYVPEVAHGQPVFARLTAFPGAAVNGRNVKLSFQRNGPIKPRVVTSQGVNKSNFATLTGGDSVTLSLVFGNSQTLGVSATFSSVTTVQNVVDRLNTAYSTASLAATGGQIDSTLSAVVCKMSGPYRFTDPVTKDSFFISFNGLAPININPPAGTYSAQTLATYVNGRISAAGQASAGTAFVYTSPTGAVFLALKSLTTDVTASSLRLLPGSPNAGPSPADFMDTLDMLGLTPGTYRAGFVAQLYGADEVEVSCPSPLPGATLTISGSSVTMAKLGLPSSVSVSSTVGVQSAVAPTSHALLPEMMEFHEEQDDYDSVVQDFDNKSAYNQLRPQDGTANVGLDQLLGPDGKLAASLIPRILNFLGAQQLDLGSGLFGSLLGASLTPKITARHDWPGSGFYNLLFESTADMGSNSPTLNTVIRIYTLQGRVYITLNAKVTAQANAIAPFTRDTTAHSYVLVLDKGALKFGIHRSTDSATWNDFGWDYNAVIDPNAQDSTYSEVASLGEALIGSESERLAPRIGTPLASGEFHLLYQARGSDTTTRIRIYVKSGDPDGGDFIETGFLWITVNARWQGGAWHKDTAGVRATAMRLSVDSFSFVSRNAGDDSSWDETTWDKSPVTGTFVDGTVYLGGVLEIAGSSADPTIPAIKTNRFSNGGANLRTLLFASPAAGPFATCPLRVYMVHRNSFFGEGYEFTFNARWDEAQHRWYADDFNQKSFSWLMGQDSMWLLSKDNGAHVQWVENPVSGWTMYSLFQHHSFGEGTPGVITQDGVFSVEFADVISNPSNTDAVKANSVYASSMIKSWGKIRGDGPLITNISVRDGFNCGFAGYDSGASAYNILFNTGMANTDYAISFGGRATNQNTTPPNEPTTFFNWLSPQRYLHNAVVISQDFTGFTYYPLTSVNSGTMAASMGTMTGQYMYFMVIGKQ